MVLRWVYSHKIEEFVSQFSLFEWIFWYEDRYCAEETIPILLGSGNIEILLEKIGFCEVMTGDLIGRNVRGR